MTKIIALLGSVTPPGRLSRAVTTAADRASALDVEVIDLASLRLGFADGRPIDQLADDTPGLVQSVSAADGLVIATPIYRASFTGSLKNALDLLPLEALRGKPVGIVSMGATAHHYLGADSHLRDVLAWFGALVAPVSVYLQSSDFVDGNLSGQAEESLDSLFSAVGALADAVAAAPTLGPPPLAARG